jgi:hypothetical protein
MKDNVPLYIIKVRRGEDFSDEVSFSGDGAPASLAGWQSFLQIRKEPGSSVLHEISTGSGISVVADAATPTFRQEIPRAALRGIVAGRYYYDQLVVPAGGGGAFYVRQGPFYVSGNITNEEDFS